MRSLLLLLIFSVSVQAAEAPPAAGFSFAAMSDSRGSDNGVNSAVLGVLAQRLAADHARAEFVVFVGDMINGSSSKPERTRRELLHWREVMGPVYRSPHMIWPKVWPVGGNHEMQHPQDPKTFLEIFPDVFLNGPEREKGLTYSFDHKNSHFVLILTDRVEDGVQKWGDIGDLAWLDADLAAARKRGVRHIFVFGHDPAFPISGAHIHDGIPRIGKIKNGKAKPNKIAQRDAFWDILVRHRVAAYFAGHEHAYGRQTVKGVMQIVTGGAGAPLYRLNPCPGRDQEFRIRGYMTYEQAKPYYEALGYKHGKGETCQASTDFVGGSFYHYVLLDVGDTEIRAETWGFEGDVAAGEPPPPAKLFDAFPIKD